jgi:hypothetical protein
MKPPESRSESEGEHARGGMGVMSRSNIYSLVKPSKGPHWNLGAGKVHACSWTTWGRNRCGDLESGCTGSIPLAETRKKANQPGLGTLRDSTPYLLPSTSGQLARRICSDSDTANSGRVGLDESG